VEARSRGGEFHGAVGRLVEAESALEVCEEDGSFHAMREEASGEGTDEADTGYLQVRLTTKRSRSQHSESKTMSIAKKAFL
jgi:hypothetical protein